MTVIIDGNEQRIKDLQEIKNIRSINPDCKIINLHSMDVRSSTGIQYLQKDMYRGYRVRIRINGFLKLTSGLTAINLKDFYLKDDGTGVGHNSKAYLSFEEAKQYLYSFIKDHVKENVECGCFRTILPCPGVLTKEYYD